MSNIPSIAMIPSAYKSGKVYSVLPTDGSGDLNFTRASEATRVNQNGLIETVGSNVPRIDYKDGGCPKLLLEPLSRNLITHSEDFSDASWSKANGGTASAPIVTSNQGISPKGDLTADKVVFDLNGGVTSSDRSILRTLLTLTTNNHTVSFYAKTLTGQGDKVFSFNWKGGSIGTFTVTEDWQRFEYTDIGLSSGTFYGIELSGDTDSQNAEIYLWGAQLEQLSYATSYIPTNGSTVTREAETASKSGLSSYINSQEGVLYAEMKFLANDSVIEGISINDGSLINRVVFFKWSTPNTIRVRVANTSTGNVVNEDIIVNDITETQKIAIKYKLNDFNIYLNGSKVFSLNNGLTPIGLSNLSFNSDGLGNSPFYGKTKSLKVYNQALTDLELEEMTGFKSFVQMANHFNYTVI